MNNKAYLRGCIAKRRESLGLTQVAASDRCNMHQSDYVHIERGTKPVSLERLIGILEKLGCKVKVEVFSYMRVEDDPVSASGTRS
jgi:transcriptional regulator with XRE-family HTH domain